MKEVPSSGEKRVRLYLLEVVDYRHSCKGKSRTGFNTNITEINRKYLKIRKKY
jgi:hypothetical protein